MQAFTGSRRTLVVLICLTVTGWVCTLLLLVCKPAQHEDKPLAKEEVLRMTLAFRLQGHCKPIEAIAFDRNSGRIFTSSCDHTIKAWVFGKQKELFTIKQIDVAERLALSSDGSMLASATGSSDDREPPGKIKLWEGATGRHVKTLSAHENYVYGLAFSPDGQRLVSGSSDCMVKVWNVESGECLATIGEPQGHVVAVAYSPDGHYIACGGDDSTVRIWDANTFRRIHACPEPGAEDPLTGSAVSDLAFSPDSKTVASATYGAAMIRDVRTGAVVHRLNGHSEYVHRLAYSPDGKLLATGSDDGTDKVWDTGTGQVLATIPHGPHVLVVSFSPDGRYLITDDWHNGDLLVWELHFTDS